MRRIAADMKKTKDFTVIALGGSLIVPRLSDDGGIDVEFLKNFRQFILQEMKRGKRFIFVAGGGRTARIYSNAASQVTRLSDWDLHWVGIHATKLNAHLLQTIFRKDAHPWIIDDNISFAKAAALKKSGKKVYIASGWRPGPSTDHVAVRLAEKFHASEVIVAGDTPYVYDKDPRKFTKVKAIPEMTWTEYQKLIPRRRKANDSAPVDQIAARVAKKIKLKAKIIQGTDLPNLKKAIEGKEFKGTLIH